MNKILSIALLAIILSSIGIETSYSQAKVNFFLSEPRISNPGGYWKIDLRMTVPAGQTWRVGSSNIRVDFVTFPTGAATVKPDNPVINANTNLSANANYSAMTTTQITVGGVAISCNITRLNNCYVFAPGVYKIGELRFNRLDTNGCIRFSIRTSSVVLDSVTQLIHGTTWTSTVDTTCYRLDYLVGQEVTAGVIPKEFKLYNNYPNPFNPATTIKYDVPRKSQIKISVFDIIGQEVAVLVNKVSEPGNYEVKWNALNISSGTYFYKLESDNFTDIKKMILVK